MGIVNEDLVWTNPLRARWRWGMIGLFILAAFGVLAAMTTQALNTWIGIAFLLALAVLINLTHRIGTFLMIDGSELRFGAFPRPSDNLALQQIKTARVEDLPTHQRVARPWGSFIDPKSPKTSVIDANTSTRAVVLTTRDGRTIKIGVGDKGAQAEAFVQTLRSQRRGIRG